jgi:antitoxin component of MazEF toxin-antitoxin module
LGKILKWGNGKGILLPAYATTALGLKVNAEIVISVDSESKQIVVAPKDQSSIDPQYFTKATVVAKPKAKEAW